MKRKNLVLALAILSSLALAACGNSGKTETKVSAETEVTTEKATEKAIEKASEKASEAAGEQKASNFSVSDKSLEFTTENLALESVDSSIFGEKDLTVLNVWGTFCGPCINEMPELQKIYESLPKNANLIGIVADVPEGMKDGVDNANYIEKQTGVKYTNLTLSDSLSSFAKRFYAVPSTIFVDKNGNIIGELVMGADIDAYVKNLQNVLTDWKYES